MDTIFQSTCCYIITLLRALFYRYYFFSRPFVTLLRYYERFSVDTIFQSACCYIITLLRALFYRYYFFSRPFVTLLRYYERFTVDTVFFSRPAVTLLRYYERFSLYTIFSVDLLRFSVDKLTCCYVIINIWRY